MKVCFECGYNHVDSGHETKRIDVVVKELEEKCHQMSAEANKQMAWIKLEKKQITNDLREMKMVS